MALTPIDSTSQARYDPHTALLSQREQALFAHIRDMIGRSRVPVHVPLGLLAHKMDIKIYQIKYTLKRLKEKGYIETFNSFRITKTGKARKITWFRIPQPTS